jgi:hypothetical protein
LLSCSIEDNGVRVVIVEDASRFARELVTQELGIITLIKRGVRDCCCVSPQARWRSPRSPMPVPRCHFGTKRAN